MKTLSEHKQKADSINAQILTKKSKVMKSLIKKVLIKNTVKPEVENTYFPPANVNDVERMAFFTNYNLPLLNEIRRIKMNGL